MHWATIAGFLLQAAQPPLVFTAGTELVHVVVSVTDGNGQPVRGLKASDFTVSADGKARPIDTFASCADPVAESTEVCPVDFVLLLDTSNSMQPNLVRARDAAVEFARAVPAARGKRVVSFDGAIRRWTYNEADPGATLDEILEAGGGGGTRFFDAVRDGIVQVTKAASRRPVIVALTDGEDAPGSGRLPDGWQKKIRAGNLEGFFESMSGEPVEQVGAALQAEGVTFYAIGFAEHLGREERKKAAAKALETLTRASGGLVVNGDAKDLGAQFARIRDDIASQYIIGFAPAASPPGKLHRLQVKVSGDAKVRHRQGYVSK